MTGKLKKALLPNLPYLLFAWLFDKLCQAVRLSPGADASEKLLRIAQGFTEAFASLWLSLHPLDLLLGVAGAALVRLAVYLKAKNAKKYRRGVEYGSARWDGVQILPAFTETGDSALPTSTARSHIFWTTRRSTGRRAIYGMMAEALKATSALPCGWMLTR